MSLKTVEQKIANLGKEIILDIQAIWDKDKVIFEKLDTAYQLALKKGSYILGVINANLDSPAATIIEAILANFGITKPEIETALSAVSTLYNVLLEEDGTLEGLVTSVAAFLKGLNGSFFRTISEGIATVQAIALNGGTPTTVATKVMEMLYQTFIRPLLVELFPASFAVAA